MPRMTRVPNGVETLLKILTGWVGRASITDRRQTDGRATAYSERDREFAFANKMTHLYNVLPTKLWFLPVMLLFLPFFLFCGCISLLHFVDYQRSRRVYHGFIFLHSTQSDPPDFRPDLTRRSQENYWPTQTSNDNNKSWIFKIRY